MAKRTTSDPDRFLMRAVGALTSAASGEAFEPQGPFNLTVSGDFVGTWALLRSFDGGTTWVNVSLPDFADNAQTKPVSVTVLAVFEEGVLYKVQMTIFTSGTLNWRASR